MASDLVFIDIETTGLDYRTHDIWEIAYWDEDTGSGQTFYPRHSIYKADPGALKVNNYFARNPNKRHEDYQIADALHRVLLNKTIVGANPAFDIRFLTHKFNLVEVWNHRLLDIQAYAAGVLGYDTLPSLISICKQMGVDNSAQHTAMGDVRATRECYYALRSHRHNMRYTANV